MIESSLSRHGEKTSKCIGKLHLEGAFAIVQADEEVGYECWQEQQSSKQTGLLAEVALECKVCSIVCLIQTQVDMPRG